MIRCRNCSEHQAVEGHICMDCERRSGLEPYKALTAMALLLYGGVTLAACLKAYMPPTASSATEAAQTTEELTWRARQAVLEPGSL